MSMLSPLVITLFILVGSLAGFLAGLLGIGGGVILVPLFLWAFKVVGIPPDLIVHSAFGTSLAIIFPTAISSTFAHRKRGNVAWHQVAYLAAGSILGASTGAWLAAGLPGYVLKALFGLMQIGVGLKMFLFHPHLPPEESGGIPVFKLALVGFIGGGFSAFFGIGGGVVAVPLMVILLRLPIHLSVGNSAALIVVSSFFATISYILLGWNQTQAIAFSFGFVNLLVAVLVAPLSILFARLGARVAGHLDHDRLMKIFAVFLILIGLRMGLVLFL